MISREQYERARRFTIETLQEAGIVLTQEETGRIEVADCGLNDLDRLGLQVITYINTDRVCAKELVLSPWQMFPEHRHPAVEGRPGKEETFRCRWGEVYLYVPGPAAAQPKGRPPVTYAPHLTVWNEVILRPGEQYTLLPDTAHWFQAGPEGAVVSEFSTRSTDENDVFTDPRVVREPKVG